MFVRRTMLFFAVAGLCAAGLAWFAASLPAGRISLDSIAVEQPYAIDVAYDRARLDLDLDEHHRYLLVVGSLSDDHRPHTVKLSADVISATAKLPARKIAPLTNTPTTTAAPRVETAGAHRVDQKPIRTGQAIRRFHLHVTDGPLDDPHHYVQVVSRLVGEGHKVRVYLDQQQQTRELSPGLIDDVVHLLDDDLLPAFRQQMGGFRDVDGDGKFTVLLSPWLGKLQGGKTSLGGFVRESDFRNDIESPFSNRCDMMYLNSNLSAGSHLKTLLAHEFMHAVSFSARLPSAVRPNGLPDEEDWLNEAIAHLAENLNGGGWSNLDYRISRYLSQPQQFPLVIDDYYHAGLWRNHGCRGATYLFLRWCVDEFGVDTLKQLIHAPARGRENLKYATGIEFDELFRRWTIALFLSNRDTGSKNFDGYRSLDLRGQVADWGLAGPRPVRWEIDGAPCTLQLAGTSAAFVSLEMPKSKGKRRIHITGEFGTKLQVTLIKLPADSPVIEMAARWSDVTSADTTARDREFTIEFPAPATGELVVESISFEHNRGKTQETHCFTGESLAGCRASTAEENATRYTFPLPTTAQAGGWLGKVVARDQRGRRACAFFDIPKADVRQNATRLAAGQRPAMQSTNKN
ncbi:MAG: hypothetical protein HOK71_12210 [Planctomycetaceae bacterium]|nr:hypothetical protein [Planctomycetaceae bacterium]MBT6485408.1 hypothetical protein [Planctomycetaceae bacterium]